MKRKYLFLSIGLIVLIMGAAIGSTISYFTTNTYAVGGKPLHLGYSTRFKEDYSNREKRLQIVNDEGSVAVFVRAKGFSTQEIAYSGDNWSQELPSGSIAAPEDTGYWYYQLPVPGDEGLSEAERSTSILRMSITFPVNDSVQEGDDFGVVAIYESTPVKYDAQGNPYADWTDKLEDISGGDEQ